MLAHAGYSLAPAAASISRRVFLELIGMRARPGRVIDAAWLNARRPPHKLTSSLYDGRYRIRSGIDAA